MKIFKFLVGFFIIFFILSLGLVIPIIYIFQSGKAFIEEIQNQTKNRAIEITNALDAMSGESIYYDNMISLSSVMTKIMENNNQRNDPYKIKEIFLLDQRNNLLAHNDITKLAKDFQPKYDPTKYKLGTILFSGSPIGLEIIGKTKIQFPEVITKLNSFTKPFFDIEKQITHWIEKYIPDLLANEFHLYSSVYPPDELLPKGSLHLLIENQGITPLVSYWIKQVFFVFFLSFLIFIILFIIFVAFFTYVLFKDKKEILTEHQITKIQDEKLPEDHLNVNEEVISDIDLEEVNEVESNDKVISLDEYKKSELGESKQREFKKVVNQSNDIIDAQPIE